MTPINFLYYSLGVGFLVKESTSILTKVDDITKDVEDLKNLIKSGISYLLKMFSKKKGGDKNSKK